MKIQPLGDYVLIRQVEAQAKSAGGLYLPESAKEAPDEGIVVAIAAEAGDDVAMNDRVIYKKFSGEEIEVDGEKLRLVSVGDLLAKYATADAIPE